MRNGRTPAYRKTPAGAPPPCIGPVTITVTPPPFRADLRPPPSGADGGAKQVGGDTMEPPRGDFPGFLGIVVLPAGDTVSCLP